MTGKVKTYKCQRISVCWVFMVGSGVGCIECVSNGYWWGDRGGGGGV